MAWLITQMWRTLLQPALFCGRVWLPDVAQNRKHWLEQMVQYDRTHGSAFLSWHWWLCPTHQPFWDQKQRLEEFSLEEVTCYIYLCITKPSIHQVNGLLHSTSREAPPDDTRGDKNRLWGVTNAALISKSTAQLLSVGPSYQGGLGGAFPSWQTRSAGRWKAHIRCWQPPSRAA